jgi:RNA recognition motif-containing protein
MEKKLYVGGLSYNTTQQTLEAYFTRVGDVATVNIIMDRETGRSKGFGFVEMVDEAGAQAAIEKYNGQEFDGRRLTVNEAKPQAPRTGGGGSRFGGGNSYGGDRGGSRDRW